LSKDPTRFVSPFGSIKKEIEGVEICVGGQRGTASMTPPILQNRAM